MTKFKRWVRRACFWLLLYATRTIHGEMILTTSKKFAKGSDHIVFIPKIVDIGWMTGLYSYADDNFPGQFTFSRCPSIGGCLVYTVKYNG